jgi:hypothetical protein
LNWQSDRNCCKIKYDSEYFCSWIAYVWLWHYLRFTGDKGLDNVPPGVETIVGALVGSFVGTFVGRLVGATMGDFVGVLVGGGATYRYISNCAFIRST